jgi:hypothetical protein
VTATDPAATPVVTTSKVAVLVPDKTTTLAGVDAPEFAESVTVIPAVGALAERVTVPVESDPLTTEVGDTATELSVWAEAWSAPNRHRPKTTVANATILVLPRCCKYRISENRPPRRQVDRLNPPYAKLPTAPSKTSDS